MNPFHADIIKQQVIQIYPINIDCGLMWETKIECIAIIIINHRLNSIIFYGFYFPSVARDVCIANDVNRLHKHIYPRVALLLPWSYRRKKPKAIPAYHQ